MNDSHDYISNRNNWWSQGRRTTAGATDVKTVPPARVADPALVSAGVADAGGTTTTMVDAARTEADDFWNGKVIKFTNGLNNGLVRTITDFVDATNTMTFAPAVPTAVGAGDTYDIVESVLMTHRLVVTGYHITGVNTNAAFTDIIFRHKANTANVILDAFIPPTTGALNVSNGRCWIPMEENESLEMLVSGAITGVAAFTFWGKVFPSTTPLALKYLGDATN